MDLNELLNTLIAQDGVMGVKVSIEVKPTIKKENTGEVDDAFNPIRERVVSEDEIGELIEGANWTYSGVIDAMHDYHETDRLSKRYRVEE